MDMYMKIGFILQKTLILGIIPTFFLVGIFLFPNKANAYDCSWVNGVSIFGYDRYDDEYRYIGSISNEFGSDSIANEFGSYGNEFNSGSMFNEFGKFGSEFSSTSAFNEFASKPPIMVDRNLNFVGYVTINEFKSPSITPHLALYCAKQTFTSSISSHEDLTFSDISILSNNKYSAPEVSIDSLCKLTYGVNSFGLGTDCYCKAGYQWNVEKTSCVVELPVCLDLVNGYLGADNTCYCNLGYEWDTVLNKCSTIIKENTIKTTDIYINSASSSSNPLGLQPDWLIKNKKFAEVFWVDQDLCLHWIRNESAAIRYFGVTWNYEGNIKEFDEFPIGYKYCDNLE